LHGLILHQLPTQIKLQMELIPQRFLKTVGSAVWYLSTDAYWATHEPLYACDAEETTSQWVWTYPYRITGEKGRSGTKR
jgi:hypothetical protein